MCYIRASPSHARSHKRHPLQLLCQSPVVRAILFQFLNSAPQFLLCLFSFPPLLLEFFQCSSGFYMFPIGFSEPSLIRTLLLIKLTAQGLDGFAALLYPLGMEWRRRTHVMCTQLQSYMYLVLREPHIYYSVISTWYGLYMDRMCDRKEWLKCSDFDQRGMRVLYIICSLSCEDSADNTLHFDISTFAHQQK